MNSYQNRVAKFFFWLSLANLQISCDYVNAYVYDGNRRKMLSLYLYPQHGCCVEDGDVRRGNETTDQACVPFASQNS